MTVFRISYTRLTLQLILTLVIAAMVITTLVVWFFTPSYPASASNLPAIQSARQADYHAERVPPIFTPLNPQGFDTPLP